MLKKIMVSVAVVGILVAGVLGFSKKTDDKSVTPDIRIVRNGDFMVLQGSLTKDNSTIVAQVEDNDTDGDGYVMAINAFDNRDEIAINKMTLHKGDIVLITFNHDYVAKVVKNNLNIGGEVKGQKIIK